MELHDFQFFTLETLAIHTIMLLIILWVLNKFLFKPYIAYLDKEAEKRTKLEEDYKNIDKLIANANDEKDGILADARETSDSIISEAESIGSKKRSQIIEKAENEAIDIVDASKSEIEKERLSMLDSVKTQLIDLILKFNGKLFKDGNLSREHIEKEIGKIG